MTATQSQPVSPARYATLAVVLHWVIAALIVLQVALAGRMEGRSPEAFAIVQLHKSVGIAVLLLSLLRLGWRLTHRPPPLPADMPRWERLLAAATHVGFYVVMIGTPVTGWIMVSTSKLQIPTLLFGVVPWPHIPGLAGLAGEAKVAWHEFGEGGHHLIVKGFYLLIALHVAGALKHQLISRDAVLARMAPGARPGRWLEPRLLAVALGLAGVLALGRFVQPPRPAAAPPPAAGAIEPSQALAPPEPQDAAGKVVEPKPQPAAPAEPVAWRAGKGSELSFGTSWGGAAIEGRFAKWDADIVFSPGALDRSRVRITIDMNSAQTGDAQRDAALSTADFFDAAAHPTAVFTAERFEQVGRERFVARGRLSLRGRTQPLDLPFRLQIDGDKARVRGVTSLDRTVFGVGQGEWASTDQIPARVTVRVDLRASSR